MSPGYKNRSSVSIKQPNLDQELPTHSRTILSALSGDETAEHRPRSFGNLPCRTRKSLGIGRCWDMIKIGKGRSIPHKLFYLLIGPK